MTRSLLTQCLVQCPFHTGGVGWGDEVNYRRWQTVISFVFFFFFPPGMDILLISVFLFLWLFIYLLCLFLFLRYYLLPFSPVDEIHLTRVFGRASLTTYSSLESYSFSDGHHLDPIPDRPPSRRRFAYRSSGINPLGSRASSLTSFSGKVVPAVLSVLYFDFLCRPRSDSSRSVV